MECATKYSSEYKKHGKKKDLDLRLFPQPKKLVKQRVSWPQSFHIYIYIEMRPI